MLCYVTTKTMPRLSDVKVNEIAQNCLDLYSKLPKTGKPVEKEWTVLSCVVQYDNISKKHEIVSLGTGSKCIGASKMSQAGDILNDSHAEVFARRGFLLYIYHQIINKNDNVFIQDEGKFKLKENIEFIFFSSQLPCGDASIIPKNGEEDYIGDVLQIKRQAKDDICDTESKKIKSEISDIHRTGAKCLPDSKQDMKDAGTNYHLLGQVRTKPGRGDRTLSVSCSDKMAKWVHLGIQGSLLDMLLHKPIYIKHFIFAAGVPYSEESLNRSFMKRDHSGPVLAMHVPEFYQCSISFPYCRTENNTRPAPGSIVWAKLNNPILEVAVQGKKLGVTKKTSALSSNSLCISKNNLFEKFKVILHENKEIKLPGFCEEPIENIPYNEMKRKSNRYIERWTKVKEKFFKIWTVKPDIWNFCVNNK